MAFCSACGAALSSADRFCINCGRAVTGGSPSASGAAAPPVPPPPIPPPVAPPLPPSPARVPPPVAPVPSSFGIGRPHRPGFALLVALLIPGAGQAYNGQPVKGFFLLFLSALILPWLYSLWDASATARRIAQTGGRLGKGGLIWVALQAWLAANVALLVLILLTAKGVLT